METEIRSFINSSLGTKIVDIFGYSTRGIPGVEIHGMGKSGKNVKEKIIYITRARKIRVPTRRIVINIENWDINDRTAAGSMVWLEYPVLLLYWYLSGVLPIKRLDDCIASGRLQAHGEIIHGQVPSDLLSRLSKIFNPIQLRQLKLIGNGTQSCGLWNIDSSLLLEHIPELKFK